MCFIPSKIVSKSSYKDVPNWDKKIRHSYTNLDVGCSTAASVLLFHPKKVVSNEA